ANIDSVTSNQIPNLLLGLITNGAAKNW
ncbi:uncharacterized protein METZ01_LOCUS209829, partial [marine metagenome]